MSILHSRAHTAPLCPSCGEQASAIDERPDAGTIIGNYLCPGGHLWSVRWLEVA